MVIITWKGEVNLGSLHIDWFITIVIVIAIAIAIAITIAITIAIVIVIVVVTYIVLVYILLIVIVMVIAIFIVIVIVVVVVVVIANLFAYAITLCYRYHDFSSRNFARETNLQFTIGEFPSFSTRIKYCIISFHGDCNQSINGTGCCNPSKASSSYECAQNRTNPTLRVP